MSKRAMVSRLLALVLVMALALSLTVPVLAAGQEAPYTVTVMPNDYTSTPSSMDDTSLVERFWAYQIFTGRLNENDGEYNEGTDGADNPYDNPNANQLANVVWGSSVRPGVSGSGYAALMNGLVAEATKLSDLNISAEALAALGEAYWTAYAGAAVAQVENDLNDAKGNSGAHPEYWDTLAGKATDAYHEALAAAYAQDLPTEYANVTLGDLFKAAMVHAGYTFSEIKVGNTVYGETVSGGTFDPQFAKGAAVLAKVLSDLNGDGNNAALAQAFADVVAAKPGLGSNPYMYLTAPEAKSTWVDDDHWTIGDETAGTLAGGYYLIVDTYDEDNNPDKVESDYLVGVFGSTTIYVKSSAPDVTKEIENLNNGNGGDFEIGDAILFKLNGVLPHNYGRYDEYYYEFNDTLSEGLTYLDGSLKVTVTVENPLYDADSPYTYAKTQYLAVDITDLLGDLVDLQISTTANGETNLRVIFENLKDEAIAAAIEEKFHEQYDSVATLEPDGYTKESVAIGSGSQITITYSATLNEKAAVDSLTGNTNTVELIYSNNPKDSSSHGHTTSKTVYIYDFGIEILKYNGAATGDPADNTLAGVGFALSKTVENLYILEGPNGEQVYVTAAELLRYGITGIGVDYNGETLSKLNPTGASGKAYSDFTVKYDGTKAVMMSGTYFAVLHENGEGYSLAGWISEADLLAHFDANTVADLTDAQWATLTPNGVGISGAELTRNDPNFLGADFDADETYYLAILTDENGKLRVEGLESGTYALSEVITPSGFDTIDPVTVEFVAEYYEETTDDHEAGQLKTLYYIVDGDTEHPIRIVENGEWVSPYSEDGELNDLVAYLEVANYPAGYLPGTGGIGTKMFYIGGAILLATAVVCLMLMNKKGKEEQH